MGNKKLELKIGFKLELLYLHLELTEDDIWLIVYRKEVSFSKLRRIGSKIKEGLK